MPHPISPVYHRMQFLREVLFLSLTPFPPHATPHSPYIITRHFVTGICFCALQKANDDVDAALVWLSEGRATQLLNAYQKKRPGGRS